MSSHDDTIIVLDEPLVERNIYRFLMHLGLVAILGTIIIYMLELVIYPQYIHVMLTDGLIPSLVFNEQLNLIHSMNSIITICLGLGFFGMFAKYGRKSGYIFLLLFIFPIFSLQPFLVDFVIGVISIDESLLWYVSAVGPAIVQSVILAFLLYLAFGSISNKRIIGLASLTLVASQVFPEVWRFSTQHLAPVYDFSHYDFTQWTVQGTFENAMFIIVPRVLGAIVCSIIFAALFVYEIRKDPKPVEESLREMEVIENTPKEIVISR